MDRGCGVGPAIIPHFVLTCCRTIIIFYLSFKSYLVSSVTYRVENYVIDSIPKDHKFTEFLACVNSESASLISSFSPTGFKGKCIGEISHQLYQVPIRDNVFVSIINCVGLGIVVAFVIVLLVELLKSNAHSIGSGHYIAFTFRVQKTKGYRFMSMVLVAFVCVAMVDALRFLVLIYLRLGWLDAKNFALAELPTAGGLCYSAVSLLMVTKDAMFDVESEDFKKLQFNRPLSDMIVHNQDYVKTIESCLLEAKYDQMEELQKLVTKSYHWQPDASTVSEILAACVPKDAVAESANSKSEKKALIPACC